MFESHHVSRHFEKRCKQSERQARKKQQQADAKQRQAQKKAAKAEANRRRSQVVKRLPKLSLAVHAASHLILAARATTGMGADHAHFVPLLTGPNTDELAVALADAGYDSEANHQMARQVMGVRSLIPATIGRPGTAGPAGHYRRLMRRRLQAARTKNATANAGRSKPSTAWSNEIWGRPAGHERPAEEKRICS